MSNLVGNRSKISLMYGLLTGILITSNTVKGFSYTNVRIWVDIFLFDSIQKEKNT